MMIGSSMRSDLRIISFYISLINILLRVVFLNSFAKVMRNNELECVKFIKNVAKFVISTFLALFVLLFELFLDI